MIRPVLKDQRFLDSVKGSANLPSGYRLWWLGQSGFLLQYEKRHVLLDPYLSDSLTTKYAPTNKPHIRMTELIAAPETLDFVDVAACSHHHTDHFDPTTIRSLLSTNEDLTVIVPEAHREAAAGALSVTPDRVTGIDVGKPVEQAGFTFHAVPAAHETVERDEAGRHVFLGFVVRFGPYRIYYSGDCVIYDGMIDQIRTTAANEAIDVAILPINGNRAERQVRGNMSGAEAAKLAKEIGARIAIPCHYRMFSFNTETPDEFVAHCLKLDQPYRVPQCGEPLQLG